MNYLFGFSGRINRAKMWLFILVVIVWELVILAVAAFAFKWQAFLESFKAHVHPGQTHIDWSALAWPSIANPTAHVGLAVIVLLFVLLFWAGFAVYVKRLHDRGKGAWWLIPYWLLPLVLNGFARCPVALHGADPKLLAGLALVAGLINLWVFIELFILRGTTGENRFGPDPLAK